MLANGAGGSAILDMSPPETDSAGADMPGQDMNDGVNVRNATRGKANQNAGGKRAALQGRGFANIPQLSGLQQIVGLALGSPEFQRH
jgi:hypothetical protein